MEDPSFRSSVQSLAKKLAGDNPRELDAPVSTAEFLDLVQVLKQSDISPDDDRWKTVEGLVLRREEMDY